MSIPALLSRSLGPALLWLIATGSLAAQSTASLGLRVDRGTGDAWIVNQSTQEIRFFSYNIESTARKLSPTGWRSFNDFRESNNAEAVAAIGSAPWSELVAATNIINDGTLSGDTKAGPGFNVSIGKPIAQFLTGDLVFTYANAVTEAVETGLISSFDSVFPYKNEDPFDVDNNRRVNTLDVLAILNNILAEGSNRQLAVPPTAPVTKFYDPNGDNRVSTLDILAVLNRLIATQPAGAQVVPEPSGLACAGLLFTMAMGAVFFRVTRRRPTPAVAKVS